MARPFIRPRVLLLSADYVPSNWSGIGVAVEVQARALASVGAEVDVVWVSPRSPPLPCAEPGLRVHSQVGASFVVDPSRFDVVHLHSLPLSELAWETCRRFGLPLVYTSHSLIESELPPGLHRRFWSDVQRVLFERADRVVFPSFAEKERALSTQALRGLAERAVVVPNAIHDCPERRADSHGQRGPLLFAGRWTRSKGLLLLEQLMQRVWQRVDVSLVIAGGHGDAEGEACVRRIEALGGSRCARLGWCSREQLEEHYRSARFLLIPSDYEPFGMTALEAMRVGCPVLARATGGLSEIVRPGSGGVLVDSSDPALWASRVFELLAAPSALRRLGERGPIHVQHHYSSVRVARSILDVYSSVLPSLLPRSASSESRVQP